MFLSLFVFLFLFIICGNCIFIIISYHVLFITDPFQMDVIRE